MYRESLRSLSSMYTSSRRKLKIPLNLLRDARTSTYASDYKIKITSYYSPPLYLCPSATPGRITLRDISPIFETTQKLGRNKRKFFAEGLGGKIKISSKILAGRVCSYCYFHDDHLDIHFFFFLYNFYIRIIKSRIKRLRRNYAKEK